MEPPAAVCRLCLTKVTQEAGLPLRLNRLADHVGGQHVLRGDNGTPDHLAGDAPIFPLQGTQQGDSAGQLGRRPAYRILHGASPLRLVQKRIDDVHERIEHTAVDVVGGPVDLDGAAVGRQVSPCLLPGDLIEQ